jgi:hypothetical protein
VGQPGSQRGSLSKGCLIDGVIKLHLVCSLPLNNPFGDFNAASER